MLMFKCVVMVFGMCLALAMLPLAYAQRGVNDDSDCVGFHNVGGDGYEDHERYWLTNLDWNEVCGHYHIFRMCWKVTHNEGDPKEIYFNSFNKEKGKYTREKLAGNDVSDSKFTCTPEVPEKMNWGDNKGGTVTKLQNNHFIEIDPDPSIDFGVDPFNLKTVSFRIIECGKCLDGYYTKTKCTKDFPTYPEHRVCEKCRPGSAGVNGICSNCANSFYQDEEGTTACKECRPGFKSSPGRTSCVACQIGTYESRGNCIPCPDEHYQNLQGQLKCEKCPSGSVVNDAKSGCNYCPRGYVFSDSGCKKCIGRTYSAESGGTSCSICNREDDVIIEEFSGAHIGCIGNANSDQESESEIVSVEILAGAAGGVVLLAIFTALLFRSRKRTQPQVWSTNR